jgi:uncharacterized protein (DUF952 family)
MFIAYKIITIEEFEVLKNDKSWPWIGSQLDSSDGFIHLSSTQAQIEKVTNSFFLHCNLVKVLEISIKGRKVRWEAAAAAASVASVAKMMHERKLDEFVEGPTAIAAPLSAAAEGATNAELLNDPFLLFPHLYEPLLKEDVLRVATMTQENGRFSLPDLTMMNFNETL